MHSVHAHVLQAAFSGLHRATSNSARWVRASRGLRSWRDVQREPRDGAALAARQVPQLPSGLSQPGPHPLGVGGQPVPEPQRGQQHAGRATAEGSVRTEKGEAEKVHRSVAKPAGGDLQPSGGAEPGRVEEGGEGAGRGGNRSRNNREHTEQHDSYDHRDEASRGENSARKSGGEKAGRCGGQGDGVCGKTFFAARRWRARRRWSVGCIKHDSRRSGNDVFEQFEKAAGAGRRGRNAEISHESGRATHCPSGAASRSSKCQKDGEWGAFGSGDHRPTAAEESR
mmetsp:Transcript_8702/g.21084  ORF Transcript_8702/g.21084 Transcript_8702/m.21084 type:complete len:283 (-) Transcript_8702:1191-2039(-)